MASARSRTGCWRSTVSSNLRPGVFGRIRQLAAQSAVYGLGGIVSRILAVLLLPLYTRYLDRSDLGAVGVVTSFSVILVIVLRAGIPSAMFRFYFDNRDPVRRLAVVRTSFWFTMTMATAGLVAGCLLAGPIATALGLDGQDNLVRAAFVGVWAQMNYEQLTSLFRLEQQPGRFVVASLLNIFITIGATIVLVVHFHEGALGVIVGNFIGTLAVYLGLLAYRRDQLALGFDRRLLRAMNRFGLPLVPTGLMLWVINFADRLFIVHIAGTAENGLYELGVRLASANVLLMTAFRTAWPAFAYSIEDDGEARRTYAFVLTYIIAATCWVSLALGLLAPWLVRLLATPQFYAGSRVVAPLSFAAAAFAGYIVVSIGVGRARRTQFNWVVSGAAAIVNVALNLALIPPYGMMGAAIATVAAYLVLFLGMAWRAQQLYPVAYQWRRVAVAAAVAVGLTAAGKLLHVPLAGAVALILAYPLALLPARFYLPAELRGMKSFGRRLTRAQTMVR
jgi:O-antigen/teichoic acid export membrane protein